MFHTINDAKRCAFWRLLRYLKESGLAGLDHENEILSAERETNALGGELGESRSVITVNSAAKKSEF